MVKLVEVEEKEVARSMMKTSAPGHPETTYVGLSLKDTINVLKVEIC